MSVNPVEHDVLLSVQSRWSPYRMLPQAIEDHKLVQCFEAARWASSSFNDQPWYFLVAQRQDEAAFSEMLGCLVEANQAWASQAGALILTVMRTSFEYNGKPNRVALHDLGQASAHLALQATALGLQVHQMGGVNLSVVRATYEIPEGYEPQTAVAVGYPDLSEPVDEAGRQMQSRETGARRRASLSTRVFASKFGRPAAIVDGDQ
ncbi:MAG: nitroreductase family protein [Planctomycetota bacterium]